MEYSVQEERICKTKAVSYEINIRLRISLGLHVSKDMTLSAAVVISKQVACALDFLHYNGIEHRDIKPANVPLQT